MTNKLLTLWSVGLVCVLWAGAPEPTSADEGMWLFNNPPRQQLKEKYGVELTEDWLEQLQKSCVRIGGGGSGAFVSPNGLIVTNHHVALSWFSHIPGQSARMVSDGFYAGSPAKEIKMPGLSVSIPWESEDVTKRVRGAIKPGMSLAEARQARVGICHAIEKESYEKSGLDSEVEALNQGATYRVVRYKTYGDVRLVFAPELAVGYMLDCCMLRAYEEGRPAKTKHYLRLAHVDPSVGDLVFGAGFPMESNRHLESAHADVLYGSLKLRKLKWLSRTEDAINRFASASTANAWEAYSALNDVKAKAQQTWLSLDPALESALAKKRADERSLRIILTKQPQQLKLYADAERLLARALKDLDALEPAYFYLESGAAFNSYLFTYGRYLFRLAEEADKPIAERLPEFSDVRIQHAGHRLFAPVEINKNLEQVKLAESLRIYADWAGEDDALLRRVLAGKSPEDRARQLVEETRLDDAVIRKALAEGGKKALAASSDSMIELARLVDGPARKVRLAYEVKVNEPMNQAYAIVGDIRGATRRESYADATGSLRLAIGTVRAPEYFMPVTIKDLLGNLNHRLIKDGVPSRWLAVPNRLDGSTLMWLLTNTDGAPGNSGSPMVDRNCRLVGIWARRVADDAAYKESASGTYAVSVAGLLAFLEKIDDAENLVKELGGPVPKSATPVQVASPAAPSTNAQYVDAYRAQMEAREKRNKIVLPALVKALKDSDKEVVEAVIAALGNAGPSAVPSLVRLLKSSDPTLRAHGAAALGKMGLAAEEAIPTLLKGLQDENPTVRRESARAIGQILQVELGMPVAPYFDLPAGPSPSIPVTNTKGQSVKGWGDAIDPDGDCAVAQNNGDVLITIPKTHHDLTYANDQVKLNAPRILQTVDGDFTLKVKIRPYPLPGDAASAGGGQTFVSAGLLLWQDEKNFIRLERAALGGFNAPFVWFERFKDGKVNSDKFVVIADSDTGLQIVRKGSRFTFLYDAGGDNKGWTEFRMEEFEAPATLHAGVLAINTTVRAFPARLSDLQLEAKGRPITPVPK